jgi:hypothetical protein
MTSLAGLRRLVAGLPGGVQFACGYGSRVVVGRGGGDTRALVDLLVAVPQACCAEWVARATGASRLWAAAVDWARRRLMPSGVTFFVVPELHAKVGITTPDALCADLLHWNALVAAGRLHKPVTIITNTTAPSCRLSDALDANVASAVRAALLVLPASVPSLSVSSPPPPLMFTE